MAARLALLPLTLLAVGAAPAIAAVHVEQHTTRSPGGKYDSARVLSGGTITGTGDGPADVVVRSVGTTTTVTDPGGVTAGGECVAFTSDTATCPRWADRTSAPGFAVQLTPGADRFVAISDAAISLSVDAGAGDDVVDLRGVTGRFYDWTSTWSVGFPTTADGRLVGGPGDDALIGGPESDWLTGGPGADTLDGGPGTDIAVYADATGPVTASLADGRADADGYGGADALSAVEGLAGGPHGDHLAGGPGDDGLFGGGGPDELDGLGGDDALADHATQRTTPADDAPDRLLGGDGDDTLDVSGGGDVVDAGAGDDVVATWHALSGPGGMVIACGPGDDRSHSLLGARLAADCERYAVDYTRSPPAEVRRRTAWSFDVSGTCGSITAGRRCPVVVGIRDATGGRLLVRRRLDTDPNETRSLRITIPRARRLGVGPLLEVRLGYADIGRVHRSVLLVR